MDLSGALDTSALAQAKAFSTEIIPVSKPDLYISTITLHWTVEDWSWVDANGYYNFVVLKRQGVWSFFPTTSVLLNASEPPSPGYAAHAYEDNSHNIGIGINALASYPDGQQTSPSDFGPQPLEKSAVELACALAARLCWDYTVDNTGVTTHGELAITGKYFITDQTSDGVTRWDLARLEASPDPVTKTECTLTANNLRARTLEYYDALTKDIVVT